MSGEISEALAVGGQIAREQDRRLTRLEDDLYGKDGLRVAITALATSLKDVPDQLTAIQGEVARLKVAEEAHAQLTAKRRSWVEWARTSVVAIGAAVITGWMDRHGPK